MCGATTYSCDNHGNPGVFNGVIPMRVIILQRIRNGVLRALDSGDIVFMSVACFTTHF